ncbi:GGDEF domain-containing protein [Ensifer sp.]|jgi:diguanylate cyclase (GGDEF)-like protein|uniref:GGDEF domain-containing protein n=1 Tax=Ensifer sp. TaxID=1872086 RepID=UPI002E1090FD|nr:GGDEF domain-containing protein [Ensifer sp.]
MSNTGGSYASPRADVAEARTAKVLRRKLQWLIAIVVACTGVLATEIIAASYSDFVIARRNLTEVMAFCRVLDAANYLSAERGPSNGMLGIGVAPGSPVKARLAEFRARSDASLAQLVADIDNASRAEPADALSPILVEVQRRLALARVEVDRIAALPPEERNLAEIQAAIEAMFGVIDALRPAIDWNIQRLTNTDPNLAGIALAAQMLANLREDGGRLGSQIMAPVAVGKPLEAQNLADSERTRGRLQEVWSIVGKPGALPGLSPADIGDLAKIDREFFGEGLAMIDGIIAVGRNSGAYPMTAEQLTDRFVPKMKPLEDLRRSFMDATVERLSANKTRASIKLAVATLATFALFLVLLVLMRRARSLVFEPLLLARHSIIELANDRPISRLQGKGGEGEMGRLFDAIDVLRQRLDERTLLMQHLERQAETDELTGLLNRRALELIGSAEHKNGGDQQVCLILMDIDHFKQINDTHGHLVGDIVLKETARIIRNSVRNSDLVARFGGEEFAVITPGDNIESALALAERIRFNLAREPIVVSEGRALTVTASFGVAEGRSANGGWTRLIARADTELYRAKSEGRNRVCVQQASASLAHLTSAKSARA